MEQEVKAISFVNKTENRVLLVIIIAICGLVGYFGLNTYKSYSFYQKIDVLSSDYTLTPSKVSFKDVLITYSSNPYYTIIRIYSFTYFESKLEEASSKMIINPIIAYDSDAKVFFFITLELDELNYIWIYYRV